MCMCVCIVKIHLLPCLLLLIDSYIHDFMNAYIEVSLYQPIFCVCKYDRMYYACNTLVRM